MAAIESSRGYLTKNTKKKKKSEVKRKKQKNRWLNQSSIACKVSAGQDDSLSFPESFHDLAMRSISRNEKGQSIIIKKK